MNRTITRSAAFATALLLGFASTIANGPAIAQERARTVINPPSMPNTTQHGYSQATVVAPGARITYISGQVGWMKGMPNDFESQVDRAFANMSAALEAAGSRNADVVKITLLIKDHDPAKLAYLVKKRREVFGSSPPASTLIPVLSLYADDVAFEIDAVAVASDPR